jgi:hypothetical protein
LLSPMVAPHPHRAMVKRAQVPPLHRSRAGNFLGWVIGRPPSKALDIEAITGD